jgi:hypothetical protein
LAKAAAFVVAYGSADRHCGFGKNRGCEERCATVFAAVHTMADADPDRFTCCDKTDIAAKTAALDLFHPMIPFPSAL